VYNYSAFQALPGFAGRRLAIVFETGCACRRPGTADRNWSSRSCPFDSGSAGLGITITNYDNDDDYSVTPDFLPKFGKISHRFLPPGRPSHHRPARSTLSRRK